MSHFSRHERVYVMELLEKFLNGSKSEPANCVQDDAEMWSRLRDLSALCSALDSDRGNR